MGISLNTEFDLWNSLRYSIFSGCWEFTGGLDKDGYGRFFMDGRKIPAHRAAWEFTFGQIPDGLEACHSCDNPRCCNPNHLWLGSNSENQADKVKKGRQSKGASNGRAKLTDDQVNEIRRALSVRRFGDLSHLAREYDVSVSTIWGIRHGKNWSVESPLQSTSVGM